MASKPKKSGTPTALQKLREIERLMDAELRRLRGQIRAAEKGENKRIKDVNKYIARVNRQIARTQKENAKIQEQELARLEKFLGEQFDSLSEARRALKQQTVKLTPKEQKKFQQKETKRRPAKQTVTSKETSKQLTSTKHYTVRQLKKSEHESLSDFLQDKPYFDSIGKNYLAPGEYITVSVPYRYRGNDNKLHTSHAIGKRAFKSWAAMRDYLTKYFEDGMDEDWLERIEIVKFNNHEQWAIARGKQVDINERHKRERRAREKERNRQLREAKRKQRKAERELEQLKRKQKG